MKPSSDVGPTTEEGGDGCAISDEVRHGNADGKAGACENGELHREKGVFDPTELGDLDRKEVRESVDGIVHKEQGEVSFHSGFDELYALIVALDMESVGGGLGRPDPSG